MRAGNFHTPQVRTHMQSPSTETLTTTFQRNAHADKSLRCWHWDTHRNNETSSEHHANEDEKDDYQHTTSPPCPQHCNPHKHCTQHTDQRRHAQSALLHEHDNQPPTTSNTQYDANNTQHLHDQNRTNPPPAAPNTQTNKNTRESNVGNPDTRSPRSSTGDDIDSNPERADTQQHSNMTQPNDDDDTEPGDEIFRRATHTADHLMYRPNSEPWATKHRRLLWRQASVVVEPKNQDGHDDSPPGAPISTSGTTGTAGKYDR